MFLKILDAYDWDFCQIQYNYLDEHTQAGAAGLKAAAAKGIPVIIMEPLRGGKLVQMLPPEARKIMEQDARGWTPAAWAFRWLYNQPEVTVVLSGMNSLEMVAENVATANAARAGELSGQDLALIEKVKELIRKLAADGMTILVTSHQLFDMQDVCSRVAILSQGRVVGGGTVADIVAKSADPRHALEDYFAAAVGATPEEKA